MTHKHIFHNTGGGTFLLGGDKFPSDDSYECRCGLGFTTKSTTEKHFNMPSVYRSKPKNTKDMKVSKLKEMQDD